MATKQSTAEAEAQERAAFVLGIAKNASQAQALAAYQDNVQRLHPRVGGDRIAYQTLLAAWAVWNQLQNRATAALAVSMADVIELRAVAITVREDQVDADAGHLGLEVLDVAADVVHDLRDEVYEVDLVALEALPPTHRAYASAGSPALVRTTAGLVRRYA